MLTKEQIAQALERLDRALAVRGTHAELYLVGGAVMCLVYQARPSTKDDDGWFTEPQAVRAAARDVAAELDLPEDWLNDAAKAFVPAGARFERWHAFDHLDISTADEATLLAMKCAAARTAEDSRDIQTLAARLGLTTSVQVFGCRDSILPARSPAGADATARRGALFMTAMETLERARRAGDDYQLPINELIDAFRSASTAMRQAMVADPIGGMGLLEGLIAATVSALCRETGTQAPEWVGHVASVEPFFVLPATSYAMRVRLMLESPVPFRIRRVFVPANYLSRA